MGDNTIERSDAPEQESKFAALKTKLKETTDKLKEHLPKKLQSGGGKNRKRIIIILVIIAVIIAGFSFCSSKNKQKNAKNQEVIVAVEKRSITNTVTGSSTVKANDSYDVSSMVKGEVLTDSFNEGDIVEKDQVLYEIEATDAENGVQSAQNALKKAQMSYDDAIYNNKAGSTTILRAKDTLLKAQEDLAQTVRSIGAADHAIAQAANNVTNATNSYKTAAKDMSKLNLTAGCTGTVSKVYVKNGDSIGNGTKIADVYDSRYLKLNIPFNAADAANIRRGDHAVVKVAGHSDELFGTVSAVSSADVATAANAIVRYVTVEIENPGALTDSDRGSATIKGITCQDTAQFEYINTKAITSEVNGKVFSINIADHDHVDTNTVVINISSDSVENQYASAQINLDNANMNLQDTILKNDAVAKNNTVKAAQRNAAEAQAAYDATVRSQGNSVTSAAIELSNAKINLDKANDTLDDYKIKAPIAGTVVTKNVKAGDKLESGTTNANTSQMAVIYDLSCLKFELSIDETEIHSVKVGQEVKVTADAVKGEFKGIVQKVGVNGTSTNGVTTYPVEVRIDEYGELLPGMNIDASIEVEHVDDVLAVPVSAVNRGNVVYVKGDKTDENDRAPEGFRSVTVETGINDSNYIEIKSGLEEGDMIKDQDAATGADDPLAVMQKQMSMGGPPPGVGNGGSGRGGNGGAPSGGGAPGGSR